MSLTEKLNPGDPAVPADREEITRINLNVPLSVRKRWKVAAAQSNITMSDLIIDAMTAHLATLNIQQKQPD